MGMLDDLLRQLQQAAEQKQRTTLPGQPPSRPRQARQQQPAAQVERAAEPDPGGSRSQRTVMDSLPTQMRAQAVHPLLARLRAPGGAREAIVLSEILRPRFRRR